MTKQESTASLLFRNFIFTLLQPGIVAGLLPYYITRREINFIETPGRIQLVGLFVIITGLIIMLRCILQFAIDGKGTLSPADPTKKLVIRGLYRYSRNPMYVGVMLILVGEAIMVHSESLWIYVAIVFVAFNLFIIFREEPRLKKDFGDEYIQYCSIVRRWL